MTFSHGEGSVMIPKTSFELLPDRSKQGEPHAHTHSHGLQPWLRFHRVLGVVGNARCCEHNIGGVCCSAKQVPTAQEPGALCLYPHPLLSELVTQLSTLGPTPSLHGDPPHRTRWRDLRTFAGHSELRRLRLRTKTTSSLARSH